MKLVVTGGAGFIGSALIRELIAQTNHVVTNVDKLTYAANLASLANVEGDSRYRFVQGDVCDQALMAQLLREFEPDAVVHLAAETHVDRSIDGSAAFIQTNVVGTHTLLEVARRYWADLDPRDNAAFRFHQISTDEVFGDLPSGVRAKEDAPPLANELLRQPSK